MNTKMTHLKPGNIPRLDGSNYVYWRKRMQAHIIALGFDVQKIVMDGYTEPKDGPTTNAEISYYEKNSRDVNVILGGLKESEFFKFINYTSAMEMWDKQPTIYPGYSKFQEAKLQSYRSQFESLKMGEEEDVAAYVQRVEEIVNTMRGLGEKMEPKLVVQKILRSLTPHYNPKDSAIEDTEKLNELKLEELQGILTAYKMRTKEPRHNVVAFKETKNRHLCYERCTYDNEIYDEEMDNFITRLPRGIGRHKGSFH